MKEDKDNKYFWAFIFLVVCAVLFFNSFATIKIEHEKTIQKALELGYEPISIGGDYWNKGD